MTNRYPGHCIDCGREARANHGELVKRGGRWVVSCGKSKPVTAAPPAATRPKVVAPEAMRLTNMQISSSNAALTVKFSVAGIGHAYALPPFGYGQAIKYTRWSNDPLQWAEKPEDVGKSLRELRPEEAAAHDAVCAANEQLHAALQEQGQIAYDTRHDFQFPLSADEQKLLTEMIGSAKEAMLAAILDGSAEIRIDEVGCDFPHDQILEIKVAGVAQEYALIQQVLGELGLKVDGSRECKDLAGAIREQQAAQLKREQERQAHKERRAQGYHVVVLRRCWECGRTQILGELDDDMFTVRMPADVYAECQREQREAHARSLATVPAGTLLSSVGFEPAQESKFDFRVVESDWYCGC